MSVSAPYCDSGDVYLMRLYISDPQKTDFTVAGTPSKTVVEYWISQIASQLDMAYSSMGYEIPLTARTGETWPTFQTTALQYFNAVGVASLMGSDANSPPVVSFIGGRRVERSFYEYEWMRIMDGIRAIGANTHTEFSDGLVLLRAATRAGTPADYALTDASPPLLDWLEGYNDPGRFDTLRNFTNRVQGYYGAMNEYNVPSWENRGSLEYLYLLHLRLGYTYEE